MFKKSSVVENVKFFERKSRDSGLSEIIRKFDNQRISGRNLPKKSLKIAKTPLPSPIPTQHSPKRKAKLKFSSFVTSAEALSSTSSSLDAPITTTVCAKLLQLSQEHDKFIKIGDYSKAENMAPQIKLIEEIRALVVKSVDIDRVSLSTLRYNPLSYM